MNDLLVDRTTKRVRLVRSKLKLITAHLACRLTGADEMDLAKASAIVKGLVLARESRRPRTSLRALVISAA
jgi:hypothetical protein